MKNLVCSRFPNIYSGVYICPIVIPHLLGRYFNACNAIYNHNKIRQYYLALEKYWVTQSGHFILANTVALGMGITDGKLLYCHGVSEGNVDRKISTLEYKNRTVYDCFNNTFAADFGSPAMHIPPITIDDRPRPHKRAQYTPDLLPTAISIASEIYVSNLTTPPDSTDIPPSGGPNTLHVMKKYMHLEGRLHRGYCCRKHGRKRCYKKTRLYCSTCSDKNNRFYYYHGFSRIVSEARTSFLQHQHYMSPF